MLRPSLTLSVFKQFAALSLLLSPVMFVVGCGADPADGTAPAATDSSATTTPETAADSDGSGTTAPAPSGGSDSK